MGAQAVSHGVAEEGKPTARAVRKNAPSPRAPSGDRIAAEEIFLSPLRGSDCQYRNPRLTPWATASRCSAAIFHRSQKPLCALGTSDSHENLTMWPHEATFGP